MATDLYTSRRLSYGGAACTVRYKGPVKNTKGSWLGVEWNDPSRGKHSGSHDGIKYFDCQSTFPAAGSFIRPSRPIDEPISFLDGLKRKYASPKEQVSAAMDAIQISGKVVEEVGFEKVAAQLAILHELRIVLLNGQRVGGILDRPCLGQQELLLQESQRIQKQELRIQELDLSDNLIEEWADVMGICSALKSLKRLKLNGNRFRDLSIPSHDGWKDAFCGVKELSLAETFLSWEEITSLLTSFPILTSLSLAANNLRPPSDRLPTPNLTSLDLTSNAIPSLFSLSTLKTLPKLQTLTLRSNPLTALTNPTPFPSLTTLDLTSTALPTPAALNPLQQTAPKLSSLLTSHTLLHALPAAHLQTIARVPTLTSLNHSKITPQERTNAELYYLSSIASSLSYSPASEENEILKDHPRYADLCALHGAPIISRKSKDTITPADQPKPGSVAARLVTFTFYLPASNSAQETRTTKALPRTIGIYALKGILGRMFGLKPMSLRLMWETDEWDPVAGVESSDDEDTADSGDEAGIESRGNGHDQGTLEVSSRGEERKGRDKATWTQREEELVDGTKDVGFWIEGNQARVRIELR